MANKTEGYPKGAKPPGLEKFFVVNLNKAKAASRNKRAKRAMNLLKEFLERHLGTSALKISPNINLELWRNGARNPPNKIEVKALKKEGFYFVELKEKDYLLLKEEKIEKKVKEKPKPAEEIEEKEEKKEQKTKMEMKGEVERKKSSVKKSHKAKTEKKV